MQTRLISIESQPKKVVVAFVVLVCVVAVIVGHRNLTLKFGQNYCCCCHCFSFSVVANPET